MLQEKKSFDEALILASFISKLPEAILVCDVNGIILLHDDQAVSYLAAGKTASAASLSLKKMPISAYIDKSLLEHALDDLNEQLKDNIKNPCSNFLFQKAESVFDALIVPVLGKMNEFKGFVAIIADITRQSHAEKRIESFLKTLSKNARSPMASIRAAIEAMRSFPDMSADRRDQFREIIYKESIVLSDVLENASQEYLDLIEIKKTLKPFPMQDLIKMILRRLGDRYEIVPDPMKINRMKNDRTKDENTDTVHVMVDSYRIVKAFEIILSNLELATGQKQYALSWLTDGKIVVIDLQWTGPPVRTESIKQWEPVMTDSDREVKNPLSLADILNQHQIVLLSDALHKGQTDEKAFLRFFMPRTTLPLPRPIGMEAIIPESRVEPDDHIGAFPGENRDQALDDRLMTELSYTSLIREINLAASVEEIMGKHSQLPRLIHAMLSGGMKIKTMTWLVTAFSDAILKKLMGFAIQKIGEPPVPFAFITLGSEGRKEQSLKTDQDNAIVFQDPDGTLSFDDLQGYFLELGDTVCTWLDQAGFDFCQGGIMAKNPQWCQPVSTWESYFSSWIHAPSPEDLLHTSIFFDFRFAYGDERITQRLSRALAKTLAGWTGFFRNLAENAVYFSPPIGIFGRFRTESRGPNKNCIDIKLANLPIIDFARIYALKNGIRETSTQDRLYQLYLKKVLNRSEFNEMNQAYSFNMQLRFMTQINALLFQKMKPTNFINPKSLSSIERKMLKEVLRKIKGIQSRMQVELIGASDQGLP